MKRGSTALSLLGLFLLFLCIMGDSAVKHELWIKPGMLLRADPIQGLVALKASEPDCGPVFTDGDAYYWLSYAQDILSKHEFRVRETHLDNAPYGRQVHWFSGLTWLLAGLALVTHHAGAIPIAKALEYAGLVSGPLLAATVLLLLQPFLVSRLSRWTTFFFLLSVVLLPVWRKEFSYGRIDHNGFVVGLAIGMLLCLYTTSMGFVPIHRKRKNEPFPCARKAYRTEQRWFVASGIFGGLGLWVQASFFLLVILAVGLGVFAYAWFYVSRRHRSFRTARTYYALLPQLWRTWAWAGASTSLIFYFVEYFPAHMGMRLEVNQPLYALCWLGLTEALVQFMRHEMGTGSRPWQGWLGLVAGLALPAILAWGPSAWFTLHDPVLLRVHTLIREFDPLRAVMPHAGWLAPLLLFGGLPLLLAPALFVLASSRYTALLNIRMLVGVVSSAILLWATWNMNRMAGLCMAALLALGYVVLEWLGRPEVYQRTDRTLPRPFSAMIQEGRLSVTTSAALMLIGLAGFGIDLHGSWPRLRDG
ncbi:MAG TPA: hypothetical protein PLE77_09750, partial [Kiritimatiellia bacterium]|nr:hypothetical protein [Kiritimatiellia bacterium]